jgi:hypothetical protein
VETIKKHVMRTEISNRVEFNGMTINLVDFLDTWAKWSSHELEELRFKRDLRYWSSSNTPWSLRPHKMIACYINNGYTKRCVAVYEIWVRNDGLWGKAFKFDNLEDYNAYNPSQESPDSIKREIGLCADYHKGV